MTKTRIFIPLMMTQKEEKKGKKNKFIAQKGRMIAFRRATRKQIDVEMKTTN